MNASGLIFEPSIHEYRLPDGRRVPSVTEILKATGVSTDFDELGAMSGSIQHAIALKRDIGQAVHADAHAYDDDDLDLQQVDARVRPYLDAWITFRQNSGLMPLTRERRVFHPTLFYAGTLDGVFLRESATHRGQHVLVDIKIGDPVDAAAHLQLAAYQLAHSVESDLSIDERWSVQLTPDLRVPYRVTPYTEWRDIETWRAVVATYYAQAARRRAS